MKIEKKLIQIGSSLGIIIDKIILKNLNKKLGDNISLIIE